MSAFALLLDGPTFPPDPVSVYCAFLPPMVTFYVCIVLRRDSRHVKSAIAAAVLSAAIVLLPVFVGFSRRFDRFYSLGELGTLLFAAAFPFVCIAIFYFTGSKKPNQSSHPTPEDGRG